MSVSAIFGTRVVVLPQTSPFPSTGTVGPAKVASPRLSRGSSGGGLGLVIENSSRPQKKATAHHRKTRPRKTAPWDVRRGPAVYPPLPELPPEWTLVTEENVTTATADVSSATPQLQTAE